MSLSITEDFQRGGFDLISCHSPLILLVELGNGLATASSGDVQAYIRGQSPADNTTLYAFDMAYVETTGTTPSFTHLFRLNITDIIRNICNSPDLRNEVSSLFVDDSRLATEIGIEVQSGVESPDQVIEWFMHGFNQVNNADSSCLVDFADKDEYAIIPIVPGIPMLPMLWVPTSISGDSYRVRVLKGSTVVNSTSMGSTLNKGLYQFYSLTDFGDEIYDAYDEPETLFTFQLWNDTTATMIQEIDMIAFKKACEGDVVLCWLNRYGTYSTMAFERYPIHKGRQKHIGEFDLEVNDIADLQSRKKSRGYQDVQTIISAVAINVPTEYFEAIEDLFYSMDVYYYTGTAPDYSFWTREWLRVTVNGNLTDRRKRKHEQVRVDITLPEKYTQVR